MRTTVFGATGAIGQLAVAELLSAGHDVVAYVRNPGKVPPTWDGRVTVVVGEITDAAAVEKAVAGSDAVISTLGASLRKVVGTPLVDGTRNIVDAMKKHGIFRYVGNGTPSWRDSRDRLTLSARLGGWLARTLARSPFARTSLVRAYQDMGGMNTVVAESGLDWTIVRFLAPTNGPKRGNPRVGFPGRDKLGMRISRADIAAFTVAQLDDDTYVKAAPQISN